MNNAVPNGGEHADDIVEVVAYEAPMPSVAKDFLPWHRPRKQYVRQHQWCHEIVRMIASMPPADGVLKYLGLPGVDLLDLRHFHAAVCEPKKVALRFLGFNSSARPASKAQTELNISLDEVRRMPRVDLMSDVIGDSFARLANQESIAFRKARELGPYDVINLDLCDGFGAQAPGTLDGSYYEAVRCLLALQSRTMNPWLLFLTTRADKPNINDQVLKALLAKYLANLEQCVPFREASRDHFAIETEAGLTAAAAAHSVTAPGRKSSIAATPSLPAGRIAGSMTSSRPSSHSRIASAYSIETTSTVTLPASTIALTGVAGLSLSIMTVAMPEEAANGFTCASVWAAP